MTKGKSEIQFSIGNSPSTNTHYDSEQNKSGSEKSLKRNYNTEDDSSPVQNVNISEVATILQ